VIFGTEPDAEFWSTIALAVPQRPVAAVYHFVRRTHEHNRQQGPWTLHQDNVLIRAVGLHGERWTIVSGIVGRPGSCCRDRYRNHLIHRSTQHKGRWSKAEEESLFRIVTEMRSEQGDSDSNITWSEVTRRMGYIRGRQQCIAKWKELTEITNNGGKKPKWSSYDSHLLVDRIHAMNVSVDTDIDWSKLAESYTGIWSLPSLRRKWSKLKSTINNASPAQTKPMTHQETVTLLKDRLSR
jgi:hypothetical protein